MRVQAFGSFDAVRHPRVGILIEGLRAGGVDVDVCNVPLGLSTADRVRVLLQPWRLPVLMYRLVRTWAALVRRSRRLPRPDAVLVGYLGHFDVLLARRLFRGVPIVHDMLIFAADTAADRGAGGLRQRLLRRLDRAAVRASDLVLVDTDEHLAMLPTGAEGLVVPVGAPREWFAPAPEPRSGPLTVVFFGLYAPLHGAPVIGAALARLDDRVRVHMIGTGQDLDRTKRAAAVPSAASSAEVRWQDWLEPDDLARLVRECDVCLGIFSKDGKGARVVPNKLFQGAAAGCALVTSDTPPQRRLLEDAATFVPPGDPAALARALQDLADRPDLLQERRTAAWELARRRFGPDVIAAPLRVWLDRRLSRG